MNPTSSSVHSSLQFHLTWAWQPSREKTVLFTVHVTFKVSSMHPKQLHTDSKRGCSCNCRTIPLCCGFQLLDRRRQHCSVQKLLTIKVAASISQERPGGTKTSYIRCQRTSHQQEGEFSAFPELLFPLSCIPPSVQGTEPLSEGWADCVQLLSCFLIAGLRDALLNRACCSPACRLLLTLLQQGGSG